MSALAGDYRVARYDNGCRAIFGPVPINDMVVLMAAWASRAEHAAPDEDVPQEEQWFLDAKLAKALGAHLVCGPRAVLDAWREQLRVQ